MYFGGNMKKRYFWLSILCILCMLFVSCGSTPEETPEEPEVVAPVEPTPEPEPIPEPTPEPEPVPEPEPAPDFTEENTALRDAVYKAREAAVDAGALMLFPEEFLAMDAFAASIDATFEQEKSSADFTAKAQNLLDMYKCFENLSIATKAQERIEKLGLAKYDAEDYEKANTIAREFGTIESFDNIEGAYFLGKSEEMVVLYNTVIEKAFKTLSNEARESYMVTKKAADGIKSSVAAKDEYKAANDIMLNADASASRMEWENAYNGYQKADAAMQLVYEAVAEKRAAAEKAIAEAKARAEAAAAYALEADEIAPITEEGEAE